MTTQNQTPGLQTFNTAFPFNVTLQNQYQGEDLPILYIVDKVDANADLQQVKICITQNQNNKQQFTFKGIDSTPPDSTHYHLAIAIRPGILRPEVLEKFSQILQSALSAVPDNECNVKGPKTRLTDGSLVWYCAFKKDINIKSSDSKIWSLAFTLKGISAAAGIGSRSTQIEFQFANLFLNNTGNPLSFNRSVHIDIINHRGQSFAPLYFGVQGNNTLLLKQGYKNELVIYFETIGRKPVQFGENTKIFFSFTNDSCTSNLMHFGTSPEVNAYTLETDGVTFKVSGPEDIGNGIIQFTAHQFDISKQHVIAAFKFTNVQISGPEGLVLLGVRLENLPGYWDTDFQIQVIKEKGQLELRNASNKGHLSSTSRIDFLSAGMDNNAAQVSMEEYWGLNLYGNSSKPVKVRSTDFLVPEGRIAIHGDKTTGGRGPVYPNNNQNEKLYVGGNSNLNGEVGIAGKATFKNGMQVNNPPGGGAALALDYNEAQNSQSILIGNTSDLKGWGPFCIALPENAKNWPITVSKNSEALFTVNINGNVTSHQGRIKDKTGDVMPVGSIIAYGGSTAPEGWLICDGRKVDQNKYPDLHNVVGGNTPNLKDKFIIGAKGKYNPNKTGGEETVALKIEEMPSHQHFGYGENSSYAKKVGWELGRICDNDRPGNRGDLDNDNQYFGTTFEGGTGGDYKTKGTTVPHNNMPPYYALTYIIKC